MLPSRRSEKIEGAKGERGFMVEELFYKAKGSDHGPARSISFPPSTQHSLVSCTPSCKINANLLPLGFPERASSLCFDRVAQSLGIV